MYSICDTVNKMQKPLDLSNARSIIYSKANECSEENNKEVIHMENGILHIDMNNFFASVECLYQPELKEVPMAVAGDEETRRGIILAKNMKAKELGIKTAETIGSAKQKCPDLVLVPPHFERYREYSYKAKELYNSYTDKVESFGLDECWLDVRGSERLFGNGEHIAHEIRVRVKRELGLTVSVGVSFNKVFAKLGSDYKKPDAVTVFSKEDFKDVVWKLPAGDMLYVGPKMAKTLGKFGIHTIGDIAQTDILMLKRRFGKAGEQIWLMANGMDTSAVDSAEHHTEAKSIGNSSTLPRNINSEEDIRTAFLDLSELVASRLRRGKKKCSEVQISVRTPDFEDIQRQCKISPADDSQTIYETAVKLYMELMKSENRSYVIRGLGVRAGDLINSEVLQYSLFEEDNDRERWSKLESTVDEIKDKYGKKSVKRALMCEENPVIKKQRYPGFFPGSDNSTTIY